MHDECMSEYSVKYQNNDIRLFEIKYINNINWNLITLIGIFINKHINYP